MKTTHIGPELADGRRPVSFYRGPEQGWVPSGYLMPQASEKTLEASPGIQGWSHPRGKVSTEMYDPTSVARFAEHWERRYRRTYPYASKEE